MVRVTQNNKNQPIPIQNKKIWMLGILVAFVSAASVSYGVLAYTTPNASFSRTASATQTAVARVFTDTGSSASTTTARTPLDTIAYDKKMLQIANYPTPRVVATSTATSSRATSTPLYRPWPAKAPYPLAGAILPFSRIVAYYGNFYSKGMGVLGQYPESVMLAKLASTTALWERADPSTPVIPAIHYIVTTAQGSAQKDGTYRLQMPDSQIDYALQLADKVHGIVFLDIQVGLSNVQREVPELEKYLKLPNVHLGIDPEFAMHGGAKPGTVIGSMDARDINYVSQYLAKLVTDNNLPPKILVIHRFTQPMITHYKQITPLPEVQIVMDMDGWGSPAKKIGTYTNVVAAEPVQFTGFKLFYKNDTLPPSPAMMTPAQVLKLSPQPMYIQYQ
jgi:hypothetical protein